MTHPLTDEKCKDLMQSLPMYPCDIENDDVIKVMRAAYDQAVEHCAVLHGCLVVHGFDKDPNKEKELVKEFAIQFRQMMLPQQQQEDK